MQAQVMSRKVNQSINHVSKNMSSFPIWTRLTSFGRGVYLYTYVSSLHAVRFDHDVRAFGFEAAGEDGHVAAGFRGGGGASGFETGDADSRLRGEFRGGGLGRDGGGEGGDRGVAGLHGRARRDDATGSG